MTGSRSDLPDQELWQQLIRHVKPLRRTVAGHRPPARDDVKPMRPAPVQATTPRHPVRAAAPPLAVFDRRTAQKLQRGQAEIEARLDLHGMTIEAARVRLHDFLVRSRRNGARLVLVITGKGASPLAGPTLHGREVYHAPEREGKLRRRLPEWLAESDFRQHVVGFQPAHPRHGGGGAYYVRLRRNPDPLR